MMDDEPLTNPQIAAATSRALLTIGGQMQFLLKHAQECENLRNDSIARAAALAAEVERLTAENAALRAQLDAAQFTYDTDPPVDAQIDAICHEVQMDARGTWWHGSNIIYPDGWRPTPPQE